MPIKQDKTLYDQKIGALKQKAIQLQGVPPNERDRI